jgi:serine protease Do
MNMTRSWFSTGRLVPTLALAVTGCAQAHAAPPVMQGELPPVAPVTLPPAPVPATFDVPALAEQVRPMVVNITTTQRIAVPDMGGLNPFDFFFGPPGGQGPMMPMIPNERSLRRQALGTGVIIDPNGYVITNDHVIREADDVRVHLADDRELKADVVGRDPKLDIALLKLKGARGLPAAPLGSSDTLRVGESVLAVGNPFGLGHTVTLGIVSAKARSIGAGPYDDFIQTDASINPGNSGGPLFNWRGEVVGINTAIRAGANGIGFAIPIDEVRDVLQQLRQKGHVDRGRLGLAFQVLTHDLAAAKGLDDTRGALVSEVEPGGAAAKAGIVPGDVIVAINGSPIVHAEELPLRVARNQPGTIVDVTVIRDHQRRDVKAQLDVLPDEPVAAPSQRGAGAPDATREDAQAASKLSIRVSEVPGGGGVRVDEVQSDTVRDLIPGDVIVELNGKPIADAAGLRAALSAAKPGSTALLKVRRGKRMQFAAVPVGGK